MKPIAERTDQERETRLKKIGGIVEEASACMREMIRKEDLDYGKLHRYLTELTPYLQDPDVPETALVTAASLLFVENRYQEETQLLQRVHHPGANGMLQDANFYSGYTVRGNTWRDRQDRIWSIFQEQDAKLQKVSARNIAPLQDLMTQWGTCFPTQEMMVIPPSGGKKGIISLGLPEGIFSLYPMLYLQKHVPEKVAKHWDVALEASEQVSEECLLGDRFFPANEIRVDIVSGKSVPSGAQTKDSNKVVLTVWHPYLRELAQKGKGHDAMQSAICCVNAFLSQSARLLYVDCVALADQEPPKKHSFPLPELPGQFEARNMAIDIPLDQVLERRCRRFTRRPIHSTRPRSDITRGETAMPELEEIYFQRNGDHLETMQRYGICGWFLVIPKDVCGTKFQEFREVVEKEVSRSLDDEVRFVGWAEGIENYYIDLIEMDGGIVVEFLSRCFAGIPECKSIRCSTFYWNAPLHTLNCAEELERYQKEDTAGPVKELVDTNMRTALEKLISATHWEDPDIPKPNVQWDTQEGSIAFVDDPADLAKAYEEADEYEEDDDSDLDDLYDEASLFDAFQKRMEDPRFAAVMKEVARRAAAGPGGDMGDWDDEDIDLVPPGEYGSYMAGRGGETKPGQARHVHNTKRKGLSRKKDKNKRKKKK